MRHRESSRQVLELKDILRKGKNGGIARVLNSRLASSLHPTLHVLRVVLVVIVRVIVERGESAK